MTVISKGSEWHIWDLHFHTPSSYDYKHKDVTNEEIINNLKINNVKVVAVTDHHLIDIERIRALSLLAQKDNITVLPGIEFLSDSRGKEPIHFIGIFSEKCNLEHVWGQIKHRTPINKIDSESKRVNDIYCNLDDTIKLVKELGGIVTIHAGEKHSSVENITNSLPHARAQKTEIAYAVDIYELGKEGDQEGYVKNVFPAIKKTIPMIICSDNHNIRNYEVKQKLWIKGEPSFNGLKYALNEPTERFYIGEEPEVLKRVRENQTKYIGRLRVKLDGDYDSNNIWFDDINIPLNNELVTIIGHKGSGKSAISDIISICADAEHSEDYLFLHKDKFKKRGLADRFKASIEFISGTKTLDRNLLHNIDSTQQCLVRYLPQSYFEKVCNEIGKVEAFRDEIEKVVFQYLSDDKRLGAENFKNLLNLKKIAIEQEISSILERLTSINNKIVSLEDQNSPEYKKSLESKIKVKEEELKIHRDNRPVQVPDPSLSSQSHEIDNKKNDLSNKESEKRELLILINENEEKRINLNRSKLKLENFKREIKIKVDDINNFFRENLNILDEFKVSKDNILKFEFNEDLLQDKIKEIDAEIEGYNKLFDENDSGSLKFKLNNIQAIINKIVSDFTGEQKAYQTYIINKKEWEAKESKIIGDENDIDSLEFFKEKLNFVNNKLLDELLILREYRNSIVKEIFEKKSEIKSLYDEVKTGIDLQLRSSEVNDLNIASKFDCDKKFASNILRYIKQNKVGSFYGLDEGFKILRDDLISQTNWDDKNSIVEFFDNFIYYLEHDMRSDEKKLLYIGNVTQNRLELYNYIFSLKFLDAHYDLQNNGKSLDQLSPGEKGALLLIFYLVLDKEDIPLIIDQPEDNLDNNSVAKVLVPYIKYAKKKRQIILVTHNPNLAVVADSEQVINVSLDKINGNKFSLISGGIENIEINKRILEVLEGTIPAFCLRKDKYQITQSSY